MSSNTVNFRVRLGYVLLSLPDEKESIIHLNATTKLAEKNTYIQKGGELKVIVTGEQSDLTPGDLVMVASFARLQEVTINNKEYFLVRDADIIIVL